MKKVFLFIVLLFLLEVFLMGVIQQSMYSERIL